MLGGSTEIVAAVGESGSRQRLLGFARALSDGAFRAIVFDLIVAPPHRGQGLGRLVLEELLRRPALARCSGVELMCLPEMAPFYERLGFSADQSGVVRMLRPRG
jgi:GNAT superfamily N-acetyltransferase